MNELFKWLIIFIEAIIIAIPLTLLFNQLMDKYYPNGIEKNIEKLNIKITKENK